MALQAAVMAQIIGVPVPSVSKPAVDQHIAESFAKGNAAATSAPPAQPSRPPKASPPPR